MEAQPGPGYPPSYKSRVGELPEQPQGQLPQQIEVLHMGLDLLQMIVTQLGERLEPVLRNGPERAADTPQGPPPHELRSELADRIGSANHRLNGVGQRLVALTQSVDL